MGVTIHVNGTANSLVHKGSMGIAKSTLPDVCKTPTPGGPVPVPYPVIVSLSSDLTNGTKTVKVDGKKTAAIKGSDFKRCMGDEPGTVGGVKSSTNMQEATWLLYSFDVKMEGKNACRLTDKMMMNHQNTVCLGGCFNPPVVKIDTGKLGKTQKEACKKFEERKVENHKAAAKKAGMRQDDYDAIRNVCADNNALVSFRRTNPSCLEHLGSIPSKPLSVKAKTDAQGLVSAAGKTYTGDYDMHDLITSSSGTRVRGGSAKEKKLIRRMNQAMQNGSKFPRVRHGAQANYGDYLEKNPSKKPVNSLFKPDVSNKKPITVFDGKGNVYQLQSKEDVVNMYRCKGTNMPEEWNIQDKKTGEKVGAKII